jgi:hypothetical protein
VLEDIQRLLENAVEVGLSHLSLSTLQRMQNLSVQCRAAGFIRPSLELESCATEVEWLLERHARGDLPRLFDKVARLYALAESIRNQGSAATDEYTGIPRAKYSSGDSLDLAGLGAYPWETESGYIGVTALFWSPGQQAYFSWSDSRPKHSTAGFSPSKRLDAESPWSGGGTLRKISRARFRLENPKMSPERRLSAHAGCRVSELTPGLNPEALPPALTRWSELRQSQIAGRAIGLRRSGPLDALVRLQPTKWHKPHFDQTEQQLLIPLEDGDGDIITLVLPYSELTTPAIRFLESHKPRKTASLLAYYRLKPAEHVFPVTLIDAADDKLVTDLFFEPMPAMSGWRELLKEKIGRFISFTRHDADGAPEESEEQNDLALFLSPVDDYLLQRAETGLAAPPPQLPAIDLAALGFTRLATSLQDATPRALLRSRYHYLLLLDA